MEYPVIASLKNGLIVSCQAGLESALHGPVFMSAMAAEAERAGAVACRVDGPADIKAVRQRIKLPILGIYKKKYDGFEPYITPAFELAREIVTAGADIVALDATGRTRPGNVTLAELIQRIHLELHVPVMADVSNAPEGFLAEQSGADIVATTLSGYTLDSRQAIQHVPDFQLLIDLAASVTKPVIVEGRVTTPEQLLRCFELGAYAVCIGGAITSPFAITKRFIEVLPARTS